MSKYIGLFTTEEEYSASKLYYPNLSYTEDDKLLHYSTTPYLYEFIDLDLPSKTQWMKYNIGANVVSDYGLYFQWGDIVGYTDADAKKHSFWESTPFNNSSSTYDSDYFSNVKDEVAPNNSLSKKYDVSYLHTNGKAQIPAQEDFNELINNTNKEWATINNVYGCKFISKTTPSNYIFIPTAGGAGNGSFYGQGSNCNLWTSELNADKISNAYYFYCDSSDCNVYNFNRSRAYPIRPIIR